MARVMARVMDSYITLCDEYFALQSKTYETLIETLNKRGVDSINVNTYGVNELVDWCFIQRPDKNGEPVNLTIETIRKNDKGEWVVDVDDRWGDDWSTLKLTTSNFDASDLIDILGVVEDIFNVADKQFSGKVFGEDENIEEE